MYSEPRYKDIRNNDILADRTLNLSPYNDIIRAKSQFKQNIEKNIAIIE